ncbi:MAG: thermonuclease family protein [Pseudomonadota bacterium]
MDAEPQRQREAMRRDQQPARNTGRAARGTSWWPFGRKRTDGFVFETYVPTQIVRRKAENRARRDALAEAAKLRSQATAAATGRGFAQASRWLAAMARACALWTVDVVMKAAMHMRGGIGATLSAIGRGCVTLARSIRLPSPALTSTNFSRPKLSLPTVQISSLTRAELVRGGGLALVAGLALVGLTTVGGHVATTFASIRSPIALPTLPALFSSERKITGRARVVTGDTLIIDGARVRLAGLAAPYPAQVCRTARRRAWRCGRRAERRLKRLTRGRTVACTVTESAPSRGTCRAGNIDLGAAMVRRGLAFADTGGPYSAEAAAAKSGRRGIWQGTAETPDVYAARMWDRASARAPDRCPIKGEIRRGQKVYVMPWSSQYRRTRIRTARGERWFCSEAAAAAAGWRPRDAG